MAVEPLDMKLPDSFGASGTENLFYNNSFASHGLQENNEDVEALNTTAPTGAASATGAKETVVRPPMKTYNEVVNYTREQRLAKLKKQAEEVEVQEEQKAVQRTEVAAKQKVRTRNEVEQRELSQFKKKIETLSASGNHVKKEAKVMMDVAKSGSGEKTAKSASGEKIAKSSGGVKNANQPAKAEQSGKNVSAPAAEAGDNEPRLEEAIQAVREEKKAHPDRVVTIAQEMDHLRSAAYLRHKNVNRPLSVHPEHVTMNNPRKNEYSWIKNSRMGSSIFRVYNQLKQEQRPQTKRL